MKKDSIGNKYSQELYAKTKFYQKRYGFKLGSLDGDTLRKKGMVYGRYQSNS